MRASLLGELRPVGLAGGSQGSSSVSGQTVYATVAQMRCWEKAGFENSKALKTQSFINIFKVTPVCQALGQFPVFRAFNLTTALNGLSWIFMVQMKNPRLREEKGSA